MKIENDLSRDQFSEKLKALESVTETMDDNSSDESIEKHLFNFYTLFSQLPALDPAHEASINLKRQDLMKEIAGDLGVEIDELLSCEFSPVNFAAGLGKTNMTDDRVEVILRKIITYTSDPSGQTLQKRVIKRLSLTLMLTLVSQLKNYIHLSHQCLSSETSEEIGDITAFSIQLTHVYKILIRYVKEGTIDECISDRKFFFKNANGEETCYSFDEIHSANLALIHRKYVLNPDFYSPFLANALLQYKLSTTRYGEKSTESANNIVEQYRELYDAIDLSVDTNHLNGDSGLQLDGRSISKYDLYNSFVGLPDQGIVSYLETLPNNLPLAKSTLERQRFIEEISLKLYGLAGSKKTDETSDLNLLSSTLEDLIKTITSYSLDNDLHNALIDRVTRRIKPAIGDIGEGLVRQLLSILFQLKSPTKISNIPLSSLKKTWREAGKIIRKAIIASNTSAIPSDQIIAINRLSLALTAVLSSYLRILIIPEQFSRIDHKKNENVAYLLMAINKYRILNRYLDVREVESHLSMDKETISGILMLEDPEHEKFGLGCYANYLKFISNLYNYKPDEHHHHCYYELANALLQYKLSVTQYGFPLSDTANDIVKKHQDLYDAIDLDLDTHNLRGDTDFKLGGHTVSKKDLYACFAGLPDQTLLKYYSSFSRPNKENQNEQISVPIEQETQKSEGEGAEKARNAEPLKKPSAGKGVRNTGITLSVIASCGIAATLMTASAMNPGIALSSVLASNSAAVSMLCIFGTLLLAFLATAIAGDTIKTSFKHCLKFLSASGHEKSRQSQEVPLI